MPNQKTRAADDVHLTEGDEIRAILLLTWAAGCLDAIGYLGLGRVFCANMTGNTILLSLALAQGRLGESLLSAGALAGFVIGVAVGSALVARDRQRNGWTRAVMHGLLVEAVLLCLFAVGWHVSGDVPGVGAGFVLLLLSALAMGLQSAVVRQIAPVPGVVTTYITGTVANAVASLVQGPDTAQDDPVKTAEWRRRTALQAAVFGVYGLAAVASGLVVARWKPWATLLPILALFGVLRSVALRSHDRDARKA